jgi:hypothetical protein
MVTDFHSDEDEQAIHDGAVLDFVQRRRGADDDYTLIFDTIARHVLIDYDPDALTSQQSSIIGPLAEDVFDAIGDRLLPELPEGHVVSSVEYWDHTQYVSICPMTGGDDECLHGDGPTIPAAIRDAIEGT